MDAAVYPREKPWRVFWRVLLGGPLESRAGKLMLLLCLLILWPVNLAGLSGGASVTSLFTVSLAALMTLPELVILWLIFRLNALRTTFLTQPGVDLPAELYPHPLIVPAAVTFLAAADLLLALPAARLLVPADALGFLALLAGANLLALFALRRTAVAMKLRVTDEGIATLGRRRRALKFADVDRLVWRAGRTGGDPDRLELSGQGTSLTLPGWHDRSDDHIRNLLRLILQPRLEAARMQFRRAGFLACGPLRVYPDHFSRQGDTPPLKLPFALARSAHIDEQGRLAVEIEGRHEPLVLLGPDEYPLTPLVLRLISELWTVPAPPEETPAPDTPGAEDGEESELVN